MGLWQRFTMIFKSKASKALDRAEDPRETLDYSYEKQLELLQQHGGDVSFSDAGISASNEEHERELPHVLKRVCDVQRSYLGILGSGTSATSLRMMSSVSIPSA